MIVVVLAGGGVGIGGEEMEVDRSRDLWVGFGLEVWWWSFLLVVSAVGYVIITAYTPRIPLKYEIVCSFNC